MLDEEVHMKKICPTCKREYTELENYCRKCGIELIKEPNRCSAMKTKLCMDAVFDDDDIYCSYCGSPTTYAKPDLEERTRW